MNYFIVESFGYLASIFIAASLLVSNSFRFRWFNTIGCISFIIYGILLNAIPIIFTNVILLIINIYQIIQLYKMHENFDFAEIFYDEALIKKFLEFYKKDIHDYFPDFKYEKIESKISFVVLRDLVIASIFIARIVDNDTALVEINYTIPKFRDYKVGTFIFNNRKDYLISKGIRTIAYQKVDNAEHRDFLIKNGFTEYSFNSQKGLKKDLF